jgi:hypothetical protein
MSLFRGICVPCLVLLFLSPLASASTLPKTVFSANVGGAGFDEGFAVATDTAGNVYVAGLTNSPSFPGTNTEPSGADDMFVSKFSPSGQLLYSLLVGGSSFDEVSGIALDASGNLYVTGLTGSPDFPIVNGFQTTFGGGFSDAFILKLDPDGNIAYSSYLGGSGDNESGSGIAVDGNGNAYIVGRTNSSDFPTLNAFQGAYGGGIADAFIAKVNTRAAGTSSLVFATYLGGPLFDSGNAIAIDSDGNAFVTGGTGCCIPTTPDAYQTYAQGTSAVFVTKLESDGNLLYSTLVGGSGHDLGRGIVIDGSGNVYATGETDSLDFPVTPQGFQTTSNASQFNQTAFVFELNPAAGGTASLIYSSYLGGQGPDSGSGIAVDKSGRVFVTGYTGSPDFPVQNPIQVGLGAQQNAFLAELDPTVVGTSGLLFATFLGDTFNNQSLAIALASDQRLALTGFMDRFSRDAFVDYFSFDTVPPVPTVPGDITANATSPNGTPVTFSVSAVDDFDPNPVISCKFQSGSVFPIGTTLDTCVATDASANSSNGAFQVIVVGSVQQISDLKQYVTNQHFGNGLTNSLNSKLQSATHDPLPGACSDMNDFVSQVNAQLGKLISVAQATFMISSANRIEAVLGCR